VAPRTALAPPSAEARRHLSCERGSGEGVRGGLAECLRTDRRGRIVDTQNRLISRAHAYARRDRDDDTPTRRVVRRDDDAPRRVVRRESSVRQVAVRRSSYESSWGWGAPRYYWRW
jgi:hypothetical protein